MLAFNKKAAEEMKERLEELTQTTWPHVVTFHALAWAIVRPEEDILFNEDTHERLHAVVQEVIDNQLSNLEIMSEIRELMLARWRSDWEQIEEGGYDNAGPEFLRYRRSLCIGLSISDHGCQYASHAYVGELVMATKS